MPAAMAARDMKSKSRNGKEAEAGVHADLLRENAALKQTEQRLRELIEGLRGYAIFTLDANGRVASWNSGAERLLGFTEAEVIGRHASCLSPQEDVARGQLDKALREAAANNRSEEEGWRVRKDGSRIWCTAIRTAQRDEAGKLCGFTIVVQDISARKRLEETERQALIGTMSAKFAHEIRNPLTSIKMNVGLVRYEIEALARDNAAAGEEARTLLKAIDSELRRIQRITHDYMKFARIPKAKREPVNLNDLLRHRLSFMQPVFESHAVTLKTVFDDALPLVRLDDDQFWQAVLNLVLNAVEAMEKGGTLTVSTKREGTDTVVRVADRGKGMTEEERVDIFKPFFSTKKTGTGLGLPLTQQIITENGGRIDCESVLGKGTTFTMRFPQPAK